MSQIVRLDLADQRSPASPGSIKRRALTENRDEPAKTTIIRSNKSARTRPATFSHNQDP